MKDDYIDKLITHELKIATEKMSISADLKSRIKAETIGTPKTISDILRTFLNRRIELPLIPLAAATVIVVVILFLPFKTLKAIPSYDRVVIASQYKTINLGNASIIINLDAKGDILHANN